MSKKTKKVEVIKCDYCGKEVEEYIELKGKALLIFPVRIHLCKSCIRKIMPPTWYKMEVKNIN